MHAYQLSTSEMDSMFINGEDVVCKIALHKDQMEVKAGDAIIISLSTGAKYKGVVVTVDPLWLGKAGFGEMTIRRAPPLQ